MSDKEHTFEIYRELTVETNGNHQAVFDRIGSSLPDAWSLSG